MSAKDVISPARNFAAHKRNETKQNETNRKSETKRNEQKQKGNETNQNEQMTNSKTKRAETKGGKRGKMRTNGDQKFSHGT